MSALWSNSNNNTDSCSCILGENNGFFAVQALLPKNAKPSTVWLLFLLNRLSGGIKHTLPNSTLQNCVRSFEPALLYPPPPMKLMGYIGFTICVLFRLNHWSFCNQTWNDGCHPKCLDCCLHGEGHIGFEGLNPQQQQIVCSISSEPFNFFWGGKLGSFGSFPCLN